MDEEMQTQIYPLDKRVGQGRVDKDGLETTYICVVLAWEYKVQMTWYLWYWIVHMDQQIESCGTMWNNE